MADSILIVEDDIWNARLVARILEGAGYVAVHAADPNNALPLLREKPYALVVLDYNMPGKDGLTLLGEIRKESEIPIVMLTAQDRAELAVRALRMGAYDYLTKPVDEKRLLETVPQAIASGASVGGDENRIAHYEIEREAGRGGMGVVYAAQDLKLERRVALKVLLPELAADAQYETDFLREARAAAQFSHPNIVTVYEAGRWRGRLFIAMELVDGRTLEGMIQSGESFPERRILEIGLEVASALEAVHAAGMVHGDLKPGNVMLARDARVKVLDFGLARPSTRPAGAGEESDFAATLQYAPPELLAKGTIDVRGDVYALGIVLYEMVAGQLAFRSDSQFGLMMEISEGKVSKPWGELVGMRAEGLSVVRRMMSVDPGARFPTMKDVSAALRALLPRS
jgi:serine/threonine-protein kinase